MMAWTELSAARRMGSDLRSVSDLAKEGGGGGELASRLGVSGGGVEHRDQRVTASEGTLV